MGKLKDKYYLEAQKEYTKMLSRFAQIEIIEVADEPLSAVKSSAGETAVLAVEAQKIAPKISGHVVAMDIEGKTMSSEDFAQYIKNCMLQGESEVCFLIGGSLGLLEELKKRADLRLSFSRMTLPHRLFRIVLLEQIYRAFKIINGETYHK